MVVHAIVRHIVLGSVEVTHLRRPQGVIVRHKLLRKVAVASAASGALAVIMMVATVGMVITMMVVVVEAVRVMLAKSVVCPISIFSRCRTVGRSVLLGTGTFGAGSNRGGVGSRLDL